MQYNLRAAQEWNVQKRDGVAQHPGRYTNIYAAAIFRLHCWSVPPFASPHLYACWPTSPSSTSTPKTTSTTHPPSSRTPKTSSMPPSTGLLPPQAISSLSRTTFIIRRVRCWWSTCCRAWRRGGTPLSLLGSVWVTRRKIGTGLIRRQH